MVSQRFYIKTKAKTSSLNYYYKNYTLAWISDKVAANPITHSAMAKWNV
jgi:hypothetical protein